MEARDMAHLRLQIGSAILVPVGKSGAQRRRLAWRRRALQEIAEHRGPEASWPVAQLSAPRAHGFKIRKAAQLHHAAEVV
jgi:hypothetical protein